MDDTENWVRGDLACVSYKASSMQTPNDQRVKQTKRSTIDNLSTLHFNGSRYSVCLCWECSNGVEWLMNAYLSKWKRKQNNRMRILWWNMWSHTEQINQFDTYLHLIIGDSVQTRPISNLTKCSTDFGKTFNRIQIEKKTHWLKTKQNWKNVEMDSFTRCRALPSLIKKIYSGVTRIFVYFELKRTELHQR